jgi:hypothetical protein
MPIDDYAIERMNHIADADERMAKQWRAPEVVNVRAPVNDEENKHVDEMPNVLPQRDTNAVRGQIELPDTLHM